MRDETLPAPVTPATVSKSDLPAAPAAIEAEGDKARRRFWEFFGATIRNKNTREAYMRAVRDFFAWAEAFDLTRLDDIEPLHVAAWVEQLTESHSPATVKQRLAAVRELFRWLASGGVLASNPAADVKGPKETVRTGKTPKLEAEDFRRLIDSLDGERVQDKRDKALISVLTYAVPRISAVLAMDVKDVQARGRRHVIRLHEKGGKFHEMPLNHKAETALLDYLETAGIAGEPNAPLFRAIDRKSKGLADRRLDRRDAWAMVKRRCAGAGIATAGICNHSFRVTGITAYLEHGGLLEHAQRMAAHADIKTTRVYDRREEKVTQEEVERILL